MALFQRGLSEQKSGHDPFLSETICVKLYLYHIIILLTTIRVKKTTLVAWVGAQPLFLAYFGIDSAHAPSPQAHQSSFYPQDPTSKLL